MLSFIQTFGILLITITILSFIVKLLKQPIIIGYVLSGLAFSFFFLEDSGVHEQVIIFSEIGITFLLFFMGLEFDFKSLKFLRKDIFIATLWQSIIFFAMAFGIASFFGFTLIEKVYLSVLFMFSSTLLVAKWVADKKEMTSLHGKIILGTLIIQDLFAIIILTAFSVLKENSLNRILLVPAGGIALAVLAFLFARYFLNFPLRLGSKYPEFLFILSISVCFIFVELAILLGYSSTIGAFIGGLVLANTIYKIDMVSRLKPLIIFFNMLFFVGLGFQIKLDMGLEVILFIAALAVMSLLLKPIIIHITLRRRGYDMKTSFLSGLYLSQLSEFGIIIIAGGLASGMISAGISSISIIAVILTMVLSSYLIKFDKVIYKRFEKSLLKFDKKFIAKEVTMEKSDLKCNVLFFGYYDISKELLSKFQELGKKIVVIENDPENMALLRQEGIRCVYSSVNDPEFFDHINFEKVELVVSSLTDVDDNKLIIRKIKKNNPKAVIIVTAKHLKESIDLYNNDADYVLYSSYLNEQKVSVLLEEYTADINKLLEKKVDEMARLKEKEEKIKTSKERGFYDVNVYLKKAKEAKKELAKPSGPDDAKKNMRFSFFDVKRFVKKK
jgi:Kef-type K+ transport system membrane component KefB/Trk K+ transport system NAD-binding subunit